MKLYHNSSLPYVHYDKLPQVDIAAVVENKRLGPAGAGRAGATR